MATPAIPPARIGRDVSRRLINHPENLNGCSCGCICGHAYQEVPYHCGDKTTKSGKSGFCKTPAPKAIVATPRINIKCRLC
ncbi:hypothetical protein NUU61_009374 [Penicillium alfredii]|uniref:Uncharacterized protein n=1 Tax=Penicillium alfredii TaxID=1506179 RepID=A0A9W9JX74_9EURO|nr:uncharacterized protein NUU61_009374 [Penicillium alfredii]KAJ5084795.1 hypothetical protein NUU61_009374 [Penicillium alfredii]